MAKVNLTLLNKQNEASINSLQLEFEKEFIDGVEIVLPPDQETFCAQYIKCASITDAYAASHPKNKSARKTLSQAASRYIRRFPMIPKRIAQLQHAACKNSILTTREALQNITEIARDKRIKRDIALKANVEFLKWKTNFIGDKDKQDGKNLQVIYMPSANVGKAKQFKEMLNALQ